MIRKRLVLLTSVLALAACGSSTEPKSAVGDYSLQSLNGKALPQVTEQYANGYQSLDAGSLALSANGAFTMLKTYSNHSSTGQVTPSVSRIEGSYFESSSTVVSFTTTNLATNRSFQMTRSSDHLDWADGAFIYRFAR